MVTQMTASDQKSDEKRSEERKGADSKRRPQALAPGKEFKQRGVEKRG
jgi:hypothetical protein